MKTHGDLGRFSRLQAPLCQEPCLEALLPEARQGSWNFRHILEPRNWGSWGGCHVELMDNLEAGEDKVDKIY